MENEQMWELVQSLLVVVITVGLPILLGFVFAEIRKFSAIAQAWLANKIGKENYDLMIQMVYEAVQTAEQLGLTDQIEDIGEAKKRFALESVQQALNARGIYIDVNEIDAAIEAAVRVALEHSNE